MNISPTGVWDTDDRNTYEFDRPLADAIVKFMKDHGVLVAVDFGCGGGHYTDRIDESGILCTGYDGNPNAGKFSVRCKGGIDLSTGIDVGGADCVLSLEVGEHIPKDHEHIYLDNLAVNAERYVIMSWFPTPGHGIGHVNEHTNEWVIDQMSKRGFEYMAGDTQILRDASTLWWFKESLMVFKIK
jgi:hypothetical protein